MGWTLTERDAMAAWLLKHEPKRGPRVDALAPRLLAAEPKGRRLQGLWKHTADDTLWLTKEDLDQ